MSSAQPGRENTHEAPAAADRPIIPSYKPPQPGVAAVAIGSAPTPGAFIRIASRHAEVSDTVRVRAHRASDGGLATDLVVGSRSGNRPAPSMSVAAVGVDAPADPARRFWDAPVRGPLFVSMKDGKPAYVTNVESDPNRSHEYRVALVSAPGQLRYAEDQQHPGRPMHVLAQGHEELRIQPGNFLSKAIVAYPVDASGRAEPASLVALRTFWSNPRNDPMTGRQLVPLPYETPKYEFLVDEQGRLHVTQYDGQRAVRAGRAATG